MTDRCPKRLIEVDLPIARISAHARREKSIRHGHISTLHIWWARRPLAACRAVICAALWPDPADPLCPPAFREAAVREITAFANRVFPERLTEEGKLLSSEKHLSPESRGRWEAIAGGNLTLDAAEESDWGILRLRLLDFIADFANWDNSTVPAYLETSRALTQAAHESLGGATGTRPLVVDPFAGGGSIPLEALRVGADAFASDLNPVAVLLNRVVLDYIPRHGKDLAEDVRRWGQWVKDQATRELSEIYPSTSADEQSIAFLWARTVVSEAPTDSGAPVELPLLRSMWLCKRSNRKRALRWKRDAAGAVKTTLCTAEYSDGRCLQVLRPELEIFTPLSDKDVEDGIVARGAATCPITNYTTPAKSVRKQLSSRRGGSEDARLVAVVVAPTKGNGREYREPSTIDVEGLARSKQLLLAACASDDGHLYRLHESTPSGKGKGAGRAFSQRTYGIDTFQDLYLPRQRLVLGTLAKWIRKVPDDGGSTLIRLLLAFALGRVNDQAMTLCRWLTSIEAIAAANGGQNKMPVVLDFAEANTFSTRGGNWLGQIDWICRYVEHSRASRLQSGTSARSPAQDAVLPEDSASAIITDPPYYDAFPYSDLADFFLIWLSRALLPADLDYTEELTPKNDEIVVYDVEHGTDDRVKDNVYFSEQMSLAMGSAARVCQSDGIGVIVFANKTTEGWEALISGLIRAGWMATASWPIDTERPNRQRAIDAAALGSSVHVVCRPRDASSVETGDVVGEWRDVLSELPSRIHEWMPRLAAEGVVGADAIFACLGPALEIFSRYSRVEKASGEEATLREYLEHVWAAVSTEALSVIFRDADAAGLEPDARLTAMWLWTLGAGSGKPGNGNGEPSDDSEKVTASTGYTLEFDAARKISQGLGVHLEKSESIVEVKGDKARLLPVTERTKHLFGVESNGQATRGSRKKAEQKTFFQDLDEAEAADAGWTDLRGPAAGSTVLDRLHQAMLLFAAGRGELMKRFLIEDGVGKDPRFWKLAQSLSALYPVGMDEKRWVDGVLARKKGLGL